MILNFNDIVLESLSGAIGDCESRLQYVVVLQYSYLYCVVCGGLKFTNDDGFIVLKVGVYLIYY